MDRQELHQQIERIFRDLLPVTGMAERAEQIALSHRILDAMLDGSVLLCDAGTGIGKTCAYLVAGRVYQLFRFDRRMEFQPVIISTSSVALQTAIHKEYLPALSQALTEGGMAAEPIRSVVRKGRSHYVCDRQLEWRLDQIGHRGNKKSAALSRLRSNIDIDEAGPIREYDLKFVRVPEFCGCNRKHCRYHAFLDDCDETPYAFQICNHNLFIADAMRRKLGHRPILPDRCAVIVDEAHKLPETARQMLSVSVSAREIRGVIHSLRKSRFILASEWLEEISAPLFRKLSEAREESAAEQYAGLLTGVGWVLNRIQKQLRHELPSPNRREMDAVSADIDFLTDGDKSGKILYTSKNEYGEPALCATVPDLSAQMRNLIWNPSDSVTLVSGTLAVGDDFTRFREETGLRENRRVQEAVFPSPFDYRNNCLLYFPLTPPRRGTARYFEVAAEEIRNLTKAARGHALILFTSYYEMSAVKELLLRANPEAALYTADRNANYTIRRFREHPGSVLLATGAVWEGVDFPGDCVSLLIIPRLPFPIPDAASERERKKFGNLRSYIQSGPVPVMQMKLRQGFGRAIRTETDTCVIAILDGRAAPGGAYHKDTLAALPEMRKTRSLRDVERFIRKVKPERYFQEGYDERQARGTSGQPPAGDSGGGG